MTDKIRAPWTPEQADVLNRFQREGGLHPFTCGYEHPAHPNAILEATESGWRCYVLGCDYEQDWALAFMADPNAWPRWLPNVPDRTSRPLTDAHLLAWAVALEHRRQQGRAGTQDLLPFPPCPACGQPVAEATAWWEREPRRDDVTIDMRPCGDAHHATISDVQRIQPHLTAMLASLENKPRHTEDIIREAIQLVGGAAQPDTDLRQPAYDAVYAYLASTTRVPGDLVTRNAIAWRAVHAALDAVLDGRTTPDNPVISSNGADNSREDW